MKDTALVTHDDEDSLESIKKVVQSASEVIVKRCGRECFRTPEIYNLFSHIVGKNHAELGAGYSVTHALIQDERHVQSREVPIVMVSSMEECPVDRFGLEGGAVRFPPMLTSASLST